MRGARIGEERPDPGGDMIVGGTSLSHPALASPDRGQRSAGCFRSSASIRTGSSRGTSPVPLKIRKQSRGKAEQLARDLLTEVAHPRIVPPPDRKGPDLPTTARPAPMDAPEVGERFTIDEKRFGAASLPGCRAAQISDPCRVFSMLFLDTFGVFRRCCICPRQRTGRAVFRAERGTVRSVGPWAFLCSHSGSLIVRR